MGHSTLHTPVATPSLPPISPLRGLLEVTRLVRAGGDLHKLLPAIARTISESLGYEAVVINLYRPAWDDFSVATVHGSDAAQAQLLGQVRDLGDWQRSEEHTSELQSLAYLVC